MIVQSVYLLTLLTMAYGAFEQGVPQESCSGRNQVGRLVQIIPYNNTNETTWIAKPEKVMRADFIFESSLSIPKAELTIGAILDPDGGPGGRPLEVAYGRPEDACKLLNGTRCEKEAIEKGEIYKLKAIFDVPGGIPKISLKVRFLLRETMTRKLSRAQKTNWRKHPGNIIFCVLLPAVVVD
ncbi:uncharacterized protein LOC141853033 [Brevipalpus obovatus]|uniref:uncharacterized protein LOC141853033 n=1 Tax=Brevipalpus obovatus TaxID=246614 RepID=UPI003D9DB29C